jgi:hypothetical protein
VAGGPTTKETALPSENQDHSVALIAVQMKSLHEDIGEMKTALGRLTDAITKLALIEQQQAQAAAAQERAFRALEKVEGRVSEIERRLPEVSRTSVWVDRAVWASVAAMAMFVAKKLGIL